MTFFFCIVASAFFAVTLNAPKKSIFLSSLTAALGYSVYLFLAGRGMSLAGFFAATAIMASLCEIFSRMIKMPAVVFITPAVIPLVPGLGLYQMVLYMVYGDLEKSMQAGTSAMLAIGSMASAIALVTFVTKLIMARRKKY